MCLLAWCAACADGGDEPSQWARAHKDGVAVAAAVWGKRPLPPFGGERGPLVFRACGCPADEAVAYVHSWMVVLQDAEHSQVIRYAWQQFSVVLQLRSTETILSVIG